MRSVVSDANIPLSKRMKIFQDSSYISILGEMSALGDKVSLNTVVHNVGGRILSQQRTINIGIERTKQKVVERNSNYVAFVFGGRGDGNRGLSQGGRDMAPSPDAMSVFDEEQPLRWWGKGIYSPSYTLYVPKPAIGSQVSLIENFSATALGANDPVQHVVRGFVTSVFRELEAGLDDAAGALLLSQAVDLMLLVVERGTGHFRKVAPTAYKAALARRVKDYIDANLRNPRLSIADAAGEFRISERYVNLLLGLENTSFTRYALLRRLEACRAELRDPRRQSAQIAEIAYEWGFVSQAHFARVFRQRFGLSPTEYRFM